MITARPESSTIRGTASSNSILEGRARHRLVLVSIHLPFQYVRCKLLALSVVLVLAMFSEVDYRATWAGGDIVKFRLYNDAHNDLCIQALTNAVLGVEVLTQPLHLTKRLGTRKGVVGTGILLDRTWLNAAPRCFLFAGLVWEWLGACF